MMPLETLERLRGRTATLELHDGRTFTGILNAFDLNLNIHLTIDGKEYFFNGYVVADISPGPIPNQS